MTIDIKKITNAKDLENFIKNNDFHTILMDADGCLCNFNLEYYLRTGMKAEDDPAKVWDIFIPWVDRGFFCTLLPIRPTVALVHRLERSGYDVRILTAVGSKDNREYEDIINQKKYWCNKYLHGIPQLFVEKGADKANYAKGNAKILLVDDQLKNCEAFKEYGGEAVQYVPDYSYPEETPITTAILDMKGLISDWNDKQWQNYINDKRTW